MKPSAPMFSLVIPVYNTEGYLARCLDSIKAQTDGDYEVVVVDDGSPNEKGGARSAEEIVAGYGARFRCVRHERNRSVFQARITGVRAARGRYVLQADPDDTVNPGLLAALRNEIETHPDIDVIVYGVEQETAGVTTPDHRNHRHAVVSCAHLLDRVIDGGIGWAMCGKAVRSALYREALDALAPAPDFYLNNTDDLAHIVPVLILGRTAAFIDYIGYRNHTNADSMTHDIFSPQKVRRSAEGSAASTKMIANFAQGRGCDEHLVRQLEGMGHWTLEWLLYEIRDLSDRLWNRCVDALVDVYGLFLVSETENRYGKNFLLRYAPGCTPSSNRISGPVRVIGIVCCNNAKGGAERATYIWARRRAAEGFEIVWFCDDRLTDEVRKRFAADGVEWTVVPLKAFDFQRRDAVLHETISSRGIDTVLLPDHWWNRIFYDLLTARKAGCRVIIAEHNAFHFQLEAVAFDLGKIRNRLYPLADVVTVLSPENVAWWHAAGLRHNVVYMPNYLTFEPPPSLPAREMSKNAHLLYAGRVCERKGAHLVLEALYMARAQYGLASAHLTFLGRFESPEFEGRMRGLVKRLGLEGCVEFAGQVDDVGPYFKKASLFLMGSRIEGAPMVLMEAKSHAVPAIVFDMPYVDGTHSGQGVVAVPYGDTEAMACEIAHILSNDSEWARLSAEAFQSLEPFRAEKIDARWKDVFRSLESNGELACGAPDIPPERLLPMTMKALELSLDPMAEWQESARKEHAELVRIETSRSYRCALRLKSVVRKLLSLLRFCSIERRRA